MIIAIIIISLLVLLFMINIFYKKLAIKNIINKINLRLNQKYQNLNIEKITKNIYEFKNENIKYLFFIETIPNNTTIQINNKITWEMKLSNNSSSGASHQNSKLLTSIINYMNIDTDAKKIIIFTPNPKKIVMYINECEIVIVSSKTNVYGTNIITTEEIAKLK